MNKLVKISLIPGVRVTDKKGSYVVVDLLDAQTVLVEDADGVRMQRDVTEIAMEQAALTQRVVDLAVIPSDEWERARRIAEALKPLIDLGPRQRTRADVLAVAVGLNKHLATVYRWLM